MRWACLVVWSAAGLLAGCHHLKQPPPSPPVDYSYYHGPQFSWDAVSRVLVLPLDNETSFSHAPEEVRNALDAELLQLGRFEVVPAPPGVCDGPSRFIRENGRFNELALIGLAREFRADVIILGTLTQYNPYTPKRLGLSLKVVSPGDGVVVASVVGLWDSVNPWVAQRARDYYMKNCRRRDEPLTSELVLDSPQLYQRFVCFEAAHILMGDLLPGITPVPPGPPGPADLGGEAGQPPAPGCPAPPARTGPTPAPAPALLPAPLPEAGHGPGGSGDLLPAPRPGSS